MMTTLKNLLFSRSCGLASVAIMAGLLSLAFLSPTPEKAEGSPKAELLKRIHSHPRGMTQKLRGSLSVNLTSPSEFAVNEPLIYVAEITSDSPLAEASYRWNLPPGLELIQGQLEGELRDLTPGQPVYLEVTAQSLIDENLQVHFQVGSSGYGAQFSVTGQYNTKNQPEIDSKIKALHEKTKIAVQKGTRQ